MANSERDAQDTVVVPARIAAAIGVAGRHPEAVVGRDHDRADASVLTPEVRARLAGVGAVERNRPEALAPQRGDERGGPVDRQTGGGALVRRPGDLGGEVVAVVGLPLEPRPAVVLALLDEVELVEPVGAEL